MHNFKDNIQMVWLIAKRELGDQFRDWRIIVPMVTLTLFFPFLMNFMAKAALDFAIKYGTPLIGERFVPFLLMVVGFFPITVSLVIALEAFVGEKERGTIEPLLSSPLKDLQLYMGKLVAATSAPLLTAYFGITVYLVGLYYRHIPIPDFNRLAQTIALTSVQAVLMVSGAIVISTQATSVRAANLMSSFIIIPIALLIQGESILMFWGNNQILWLAFAAVAIMAALLMRVGIAHFKREALLGHEIDILDLRWISRTFLRSFLGETKSLLVWYRCEVLKTLRKQMFPILLSLILGLAAVITSYLWFSANSSHLVSTATFDQISRAIALGMVTPRETILPFQIILGHNLQAIFLLMLLGIFSFGVLGMLSYLTNMGLIGCMLGLVKALGVSPTKVTLLGILPHGIFEIPALILSSAAVLYIGVALVTPASHRTMGEVMIEIFSDWLKVNLGLVLPLLVIAAAMEAWITPILLPLGLK